MNQIDDAIKYVGPWTEKLANSMPYSISIDWSQDVRAATGLKLKYSLIEVYRWIEGLTGYQYNWTVAHLIEQNTVHYFDNPVVAVLFKLRFGQHERAGS